MSHPCQFEHRELVTRARRKRERVTYCPLPAVVKVVIEGETHALCLDHFDVWCAGLGKQLRARFAAA